MEKGMKALFIFLFMILVLSDVLAAEKKSKPEIKLIDNYIAVFDFEVTTGDKGISRPLADRVIYEFSVSDRYKVIDRGNMNKILKEQKFQMSGCVAQECRVEAGQLLGVGKIVSGSVGIVGKTYYLMLHLIDVRTGEILKSAEDECRCEIDELLGSTRRLAKKLLSEQATQSLTKEPEPATVVETKTEEREKAKAETEAAAKAKAEEERIKAEQIAKAKVEAKEIAKASAIAEAVAKAKSEAEEVERAKAKAEEIEKVKAEQIAKAKAEEIARAKAEEIARAKAEEIKRAKAEAEAIASAKAKAEEVERAQAEEIARAKAKVEKIAKSAVPELKITNSIGMTFVYITPGTFIMGSPSGFFSNESGRNIDEIQHQVTLTKEYYMQTTEVTQGQWQAVMGNNPSYFKNCGDDCPVEQVSWDDAHEFIKKLNQKESGEYYRLPTEAEWEYAARAGTKTPFNTGNCIPTDQANYDGNYPLSSCSKGEYRKTTVKTGSFSPNAWGLYDMHGNVWKWCQDWKGDYPSGSVTDPSGQSSGSQRVYRGGSWFNFAVSCRSAFRDSFAPYVRSDKLGFRLIRTPLIEQVDQTLVAAPAQTPVAESEAKTGVEETASSKAKIDTIFKDEVEEIVKPAAPDQKITNSIGMTFMYIKPGTFMMGSPTGEHGRGNDETQHQVTLTRGFYMQTTEVMQGQWKAVKEGNNPSYFKQWWGDNYPIENVSWDDVQEFILRLNQKEGGSNYRLPTEAEWEYAARSGTITPFNTGNCLSTDQANYSGDNPFPSCSKGEYRKKTVKTGSFSPNTWELYDMHGNVREWCQDWDGDYSSDSVVDPSGPLSGSYRVIRGGGWDSSAGLCRSSEREFDTPGYRYGDLGFRLVKDIGKLPEELASDGRFIAYKDGTVLDKQTNLMWAARDNGSNMNWKNAKSYCENYRVGGYTDWRMPTQDELAGLFDEGKNQLNEGASLYPVHLTELIDLTSCCPWASETNDSDATMFNFGDGMRGWSPQSNEGDSRALPARSIK
ncbi:MAG: SUMF1/EgtB/PvdO family nonheme iron enzyme [Desulfobacterales bacterium]